MRVDVNAELKHVYIWLTHTDQQNPQSLQTVCSLTKEYATKKYLVAVYRSGTDDLFETTLALLKHNRIATARSESENE